MPGVKILVAAHKEYGMPADSAYLPVSVGASGKRRLSYELCDDCGENISRKNPLYCELTALYWGWKHIDELQADYVGLAHYRRHFAGVSFSRGRVSGFVTGKTKNPWEVIATGAELKSYLQDVDILLPQRRNYYIESNFSQYANAHNPYVLGVLREVIEEKYPDYISAYDSRMKKTWGHRFNMMVMSRTKLEEYCSWLFDILFELERRLEAADDYEIEARLFGFVSERLIDVWLDRTGYAYREIPYVNIEGENKLKKGVAMIGRKLKSARRKVSSHRVETEQPARPCSCADYCINTIGDDNLPERSDRVVAVVVTYNRCELLEENIRALMAQTESSRMDILVVDNASTDGTADMLKSLADDGRIIYANTGSNLGGAGGFNYGMKWAAEHGYGFCWVMDDDCIPKPDAMEAFLKYEASHAGEYGFLSSKILWKDGNPCSMNVQRETMYKAVRNWNREVIPVAMASFVSLWVPVARLYEVGLPIRDFFIWTDDWEFTRRLSRDYPSYLLTDSVCVHKCASNVGADISGSGLDRIDRFNYLYRNDVVLYRREGLKGFGYEAIRLGGHIARVAIKSRDSKLKRIGIIVGATGRGLKFRPEIEFPE